MQQEPQIINEPRPEFPDQKQPTPGLEEDLEQKPRFQAPLYKASGKLEGKRALITGGDSGIGRAVALLYAREGADVAIGYLPQEQRDAERTQSEVEAEGRRCVLIPGDLAEEAACRETVELAVRELGGLDILVSNAAHQNRKQNLDELTFEEFDRTFKINIYAYYHLVKAAVPHMKPGAAIIATSSVQASKPSADLPDYAATKGAINTFSKSLAQMLISKGIRVNVVAPGPVWTPLNPADEGMTKKRIKEFGGSTPIGRPAQPEEIAPAYVFFASDADSSYVSGAVLAETGGIPIM